MLKCLSKLVLPHICITPKDKWMFFLSLSWCGSLKLAEADQVWLFCTSIRVFLCELWALPSFLPSYRCRGDSAFTFQHLSYVWVLADICPLSRRTDRGPPHTVCWAHFTCNKKEVSVCSLCVKKESAMFILKLNFWTWSAHVRHILFTYSSPGMFSIKLYDGTHSKQKQSSSFTII